MNSEHKIRIELHERAQAALLKERARHKALGDMVGAGDVGSLLGLEAAAKRAERELRKYESTMAEATT